MSIWEDTIARRLRALHLDTVRNKILVLAVLATLIPTLATLLSYRRNQPSLNDTIAQEVRSVSAETARDMDQWLTERLSDLRVAANSYVASENLARIRPGSEGGQALGRLRDYLTSARDRLTGCEALAVVDARGRVVTSSTGRTSSPKPPWTD